MKRSVVGLVTVLVPLGLWLLWPSKPPQLGGDKDVYETVDALFTAVRSHDARLIDGCEQQLSEYTKAGKLPTEAAHYLDDVVSMARQGKRRPAAEKLYQFMKAQRRAS